MDSSIIATVIIAGLGSGGVGAAIVSAWAARRKVDADAGAVLALQQREFSDDLREMVRELQARLDVAEQRIGQLEDDKLKLQAELLTLKAGAAQAEGRISVLTDERDRWKNEAGRLAKVEAEQQARIMELEAKVRELEARLAAVENGRRGANRGA